MRKLSFFFLSSILFSLATAKAQVNLVVDKIPANTPATDIIYIAGSFNGWDPASTPLTQNPDKTYTITLNLPENGDYQYKFTRGDWKKVEGNELGEFLPNRSFSYNGSPQIITNTIASWTDLAGSQNSHSANAQVQILDSLFYMPELKRYRRIWLYLPQDYATSTKYYPVIYMQDGQNLFDKFYSYAGEWKVDETLTNLENKGYYGCIVVGIDNGEAKRIDEYSPWINTQYGGGEGDEYINFIVNTLKPHVDAQFRTRTEANFTAIMGSSMGGLISLYGALTSPDVFGRAGVFSPSLWFSNKVYTYAAEKGGNTGQQKTYFLAGGKEDNGSVVKAVTKMIDTLKKAGVAEANLQNTTDPEGNHNEQFWAKYVASAVEWLLPNAEINSTATAAAQLFISVKNLPQNIVINTEREPSILEGILFNINGDAVWKQQFYKHANIPKNNLPTGVYLLKVYKKGICTFSDKIGVVR